MNTRFAVAVHVLTFLQTQNGQPTTSDLIASSVNTNPSLIRRLLTRLSAAGLTTSQMGTGGGALLARPASHITLLDVHRALGSEPRLPVHESPNPRCPVGRNIQGVLERRAAAVEHAVEGELARTTIADLAHDVATHERRHAKDRRGR
jgi:Rrf2 family protein